MFILFDQGTPVGIADWLHGHTIRTVRQQGWSTLLNGDLLNAAELGGFDVLLTTDKNMRHQQNLQNRKIAIVALGMNRWSLVQRYRQQVIDAVNTAMPGTHSQVEIDDQ